MTSTKNVWDLPCKSQEFESGPVCRHQWDRVTIAYDCEMDDGTYIWEEVVFSGVVAMKYVTANQCTPDQISAYDKVQEVIDSDWARGVYSIAPEAKHYRMFFDDFGAYEMLATGFVPPPDPLSQ